MVAREYIKFPKGHAKEGQSTGYFEMHPSYEKAPRLFFMTRTPTGAGESNLVLNECYRKPDGNLFELPIDDGMGENNTKASACNRISSNGAMAVNIYLAKPGWRHAVAKDLIDILELGVAVQAKAKQDAHDNSPARVAERAAEINADAMTKALIRISGGNMSLAAAEAIVAQAKEAALIKPAARAGASP